MESPSSSENASTANPPPPDSPAVDPPNSDPGSSVYWNAPKWLIFLASVLLSLIIIYWVIHNCSGGSEYIKLNSKQIERISSLIYFHADGRPATQDNNRADSGAATTDTSNAPGNEGLIKAQSDSLITRFLEVELNGNLDTAQTTRIKNYLVAVDQREAIAFLTDTRFEVKSYFFLTGCSVYVEIIFWSLFGVLASLLYYVTNAARPDQQSGFKPDEIPYQAAKLFYAPLCTLVIVLGYGLFSSQDLVNIDAGKGMIVFAFIGGFYSGRMMAFLDRLKDLVFPGTDPASQNSANKGNGGGGGINVSNTATDVNATITLDNTGLSTEQAQQIATNGWTNVVITLESQAGDAVIVMESSADNQNNRFTAKNVAYGVYTLKAKVAAKDGSGTAIAFEGKQDLNVNQPTIQAQLIIVKSDITN